MKYNLGLLIYFVIIDLNKLGRDSVFILKNVFLVVLILKKLDILK